MKNKKLKIVFMGTPNIACQFLQYLVENEDVQLVCTAPDVSAGRNMQLQCSDVKKMALERKCKILQPKELKNEETIQQIKEIAPDLIIVVAYGYFLPKEILDIPKLGSFNIHFSVLPKYRGASPVAWAIINGEKETGVTSFFINEKMDSGNIICSKKIAIEEKDNRETLMDKLINLGVDVLKETISLIKTGKVMQIKQDDSNKCLAPKLKKEHGIINWNEPSRKIFNKIRGLCPWPGSYSFLEKNGKRSIIKFFDPSINTENENYKNFKPGEIIKTDKQKGVLIKCMDSAIWIKKLQAEGKKIVDAYDFFLGKKTQGEIFK